MGLWIWSDVHDMEEGMCQERKGTFPEGRFVRALAVLHTE